MSLRRRLGQAGVGAVTLIVTIVSADAQQRPTEREPASKAAAILTWPEERRERYIKALDDFFLTRTVKAGRRANALVPGRPLVTFENGGLQARDVDDWNLWTGAPHRPPASSRHRPR